MDTWMQDLRFGMRQLRKSPAFTLISVLALALGIGANSAVFSVVDTVMLTPLPFPEPDRLAMIWEDNHSRNLVNQQTSGKSYLDYRNMKHVFEDVAAWWEPDVNLADEFGEPLRVETIDISGNFFQVMKVAPSPGRGLLPGEDILGAELVAVIGHGLWQRRYGGDPSILGATITLDGDQFKIVGVAPPGFSFPGKTEVWRSLGWEPEKMSRGARFISAIGRLAPAVSLEQAQAELDAFSRRWQEESPNTNKGWQSRAVLLREEWLGDVRDSLLLLLAAVGLVLLLACSNLANLLLARSSEREREVGIRMAMGAGRLRLMRQFLSEGMLLALLGGAAGLFLAWIGLKLAVALTPFDIPRLQSVGIDGRILGFTLLVTALTGLFFTVFPALQASRPKAHLSLQESSRLEAADSQRSRLRGILVVGEVALALVLLIGSGLLIRSFITVLQEEPGVEPAQVVTFNIQLPMGSYTQWDRISDFYTALIERAQSRPGIESVGGAGYLPLERAWRILFTVRGRPPVPTPEAPQAQYRFVTPGYFETMSIPLIRGRLLEPSDDKNSGGVALINQTLAAQLWPDQNPVGDVIVLGTNRLGPLAQALLRERDYQVVGVVGDVKNNTLEKDVEPAIYLSHKQFPCRSMNIVMRGRGSAVEISQMVSQEVRRLDPALAPSQFRTLDQLLSDALAERRFFMGVLTGFAALALFLATLGVYGILSYSVTQRRREIGLRMAMGAARADIHRLVTRQGLTLAALGIGLGVLVSLAATRVMSGMLYGIDAADPVTFVAVPLVFLLAGWIACYFPARRATAVDPIITLRWE